MGDGGRSEEQNQATYNEEIYHMCTCNDSGPDEREQYDAARQVEAEMLIEEQWRAHLHYGDHAKLWAEQDGRCADCLDYIGVIESGRLTEDKAGIVCLGCHATRQFMGLVHRVLGQELAA